MPMSVREAALQLDISERRILQLIGAGTLSADRFGSVWMISAEDVARTRGHRRLRGRPLGPLRAWGLLDILGGGAAPWLSPPARSQLRGSVGRFAGADADRWRAALHGRSEVRRCFAHPAALNRLSSYEQVLPAGAQIAVERGFDLVVSDDSVTEVYARQDEWPRIAKSLAIKDASSASLNLLVRLPRRVWPFDGARQVADAAVAADLLESPEPRAVVAGLDTLNAKLDLFMRAVRQ